MVEWKEERWHAAGLNLNRVHFVLQQEQESENKMLDSQARSYQSFISPNTMSDMAWEQVLRQRKAGRGIPFLPFWLWQSAAQRQLNQRLEPDSLFNNLSRDSLPLICIIPFGTPFTLLAPITSRGNDFHWLIIIAWKCTSCCFPGLAPGREWIVNSRSLSLLLPYLQWTQITSLHFSSPLVKSPIS